VSGSAGLYSCSFGHEGVEGVEEWEGACFHDGVWGAEAAEGPFEPVGSFEG